MWVNSMKRLLTLLLCVYLLAACSSGEERQAMYLERAQQYFDDGVYDKARIDVRNALQINDKHAGARYLFAKLFEVDKNWREMYGNLRRAIELDPELLPARIRLGHLYLLNRQYDNAVEEADYVLTLDERNADALALRSVAFYRQGLVDEAEVEALTALKYESGHLIAVSVLTEIYKGKTPDLALSIIGDGLKEQPELAALELLKIRVLEHQDDLDGAIEVYDSLITNNPEELYYYYLYVSFLEEYNRIEQATTMLRDIVRARPEDENLKLWLASFLANNEDIKSAETALIEFLDKDETLSELKFALAKVYLAQNERSKSREVYAALILDNPDDENAQRARNELLQLEIVEGNDTNIEQLLLDIFEIEPENSDALVVRAAQSLKRLDHNSAISDLRVAIRNKPDNLRAILLLAGAHQLEGTHDLAIDNYRQVLSLTPSNQVALVELCKYSIKAGELDEAIQYASVALRANPEHAEATRLIVDAFSKQKKWDQAITKAEGLMSRENTRVLGTYLLGRIAFARGQFDVAIEHLQATLELQPTIVEALQVLARARVRTGDTAAAIAYTQQHARAHPDQLHAKYLLGQLFVQVNDYAAAEDWFKQAVAAKPDEAKSYVMLGDLYVKRGDNEQALDIFEQGLGIDNFNGQLLLRAALSNERLEQFKEAAGRYEQALAIQPSAMAHNNLSMIYTDQLLSPENVRKAEEMMRQYSNSTQPSLLDTLGWVYYRLDNSKLAIKFIKKAIESGGSSQTMRYHLGKAYLADNLQNLAREEFEAALASGEPFRESSEAQLLLNTI